MTVWQSHLTLRILDSYVTIVFYYDVLDLSHLCHVKNYIVSVSKALNCSSFFEEIPGSFVAERDSVQTRLL